MTFHRGFFAHATRITIPLIFAMVYEVLARKLFNAPTMWAYDMSRFMYGALFMLGAGYALSKGVHIRADFLYRNFKTKNQGRIDFWLYLIFYFPGLSVFFYLMIVLLFLIVEVLLLQIVYDDKLVAHLAYFPQ